MFSKTKAKFKSILSMLLSAATFVSGFSIAAGLTVGSTADANAAVSSSNDDYETVFSWDNATVYFLLTDRFNNGDTSNDHSYGRGLDANGNAIPTNTPETSAYFMGGDFKGITQKIEEGYFNDIGVNAIWMSAPYEQIHGYCIGGGGEPSFPHYAYHGYYVLDYTETDANFGTKEEFRELVDTAHEHGIRIVLDIVMNHAGYCTMDDMSNYSFGTLNSGWDSYYYAHKNVSNSKHDALIDYKSSASDWANWWGPEWIRSGVAGYDEGGGEVTGSLAGLPDFKTESTQQVGIPNVLKTKWTKEGTYDQKVSKYGSTGTVRQYLIKWISEWVREYGVDGFRCDTAKHVEMQSWTELKEECVKALREWKKENPDKALDDLDFWMTGECFGHKAERSQYFDGGFDSMINFEFAPAAGSSNIPSADSIEGIYSRYAGSINNDSTFNVLSYISSHDTILAKGDRKFAGSFLLMLPGGVQIYYGDETNRPMLAVPSDSDAGAGHMFRSFMNWNSIDEDVFEHWRILGQFRNHHIAVGAGQHKVISAYNSSTGYTFSRTYSKNGIDDNIVATLFAPANKDITIDVSSVWSDGTVLNNFYDGSTAVVENGKVTFNSGANGTILIEEPAGAKYKVIVKHILQSTGEVLKTEVKKGQLGESYTVTPDEELLKNYYVAKTSGSTTGKFTETDKTVTFYYAFDADKKGTLTVKYIDKDTGTEIADSKSFIGDIGASYSVSPITIKNYEIVAELLPSNATGKYKKGNINIVFKYQYVEPETLKVHYYTTSWSNVNCYAYTEEGSAATEYTGKWPGTAMTKGSDGWYTIEIDTEKAFLIFNNGIEQDPSGSTSAKGYDGVGECWIKDGKIYSTGKVIVLYTDTSGNLIEKTTLKGMVGDTYKTEKKTFDGYKYSSVSGKTSGTFSEDTVTVTYIYAPDSSPAKDKTALLAAINEAKTYLDGEYTAESLAQLKSAITAAQKVYNDSTATQAQVNSQIKALETAIDALVSTKPINKSELNTMLLVAKVYADGNFTSESLSALNSAIKSAQTVYDSVSATQTQIDSKVKELNSAINSLVEETGTYIYVTLEGVSITPYIYSWEGTSTALTGAWPGTAMTKGSNGTYKIKVPATGSYNFVINDNGTQNKTTDILNVKGSQWVTINGDNLASSSSYTITTGGSVTVDKTELSTMIKNAQAALEKTGVNYTAKSIDILKTAISNAQAVYNNSSATQLQVDVQVAYLKGGIAGLQKELTDVTISSLTASKTSAAVGDSITLKTTATGFNLKYKYMVCLNGTWTTIRAASTTSSYTWKPTKAGTYTVRVVVTDGKNEARKEVTVKVSAGVTISSLTASKTSAAVGDSITLKTTATGSNLKYKYMVKLNDGDWTTIRSASTTSSYTWKPTKAGTYTVRVVVTDGKNEARKEVTVKVSAGVTISSLTASKTSAAVGDSITLKTTATGSSLKYKYMVCLNGTWTTIRAASTTSSYTWKPTKAGTYMVRVVVTDGKNEARKEVTVKVSAGVKISSLTASKTSATVGDSITLKTTATGSNLKYKYMVCLNGTWTTIRAASTTSSYTWKPTKAGTYTVRVVVTDGKNEARKEVTVKVSAVSTVPTISSFTASSTVLSLGSSTTLKTTATGSNLNYKYMVQRNGGSWTTIKSSNTTSSYTWKPTQKGTYTVRVVVTDGKNETRKDIAVIVQ